MRYTPETPDAPWATALAAAIDTANAVASLKNVRGAVVRIVSEGSFVDPAEGSVVNEAGSGSGFLISEDGLVVTNNHVVTGAAFLQVYVEGADFPYLEWFEGDLSAGTDVYAAGFPHGDPEYTLTEGIISKEMADGESTWSSVDSVLEITAKILPGSSGGPLVVDGGQVAGIDYAYWEERDISYAISRDEALDVIDQLIAGNNVDSIGINGEAFVTQELLTGTLNGDKELELAFSFATELEDDVAPADTQYEYTEVTDDTGTLVMQVPTAWADVSGLPWIEGGEELGISIPAAPSINDWHDTWETPGVFFGISDVLYDSTNTGALLDSTDFTGDCSYDDRYDYEDAVYTGAYDVWLNCGGTDTAFVNLEAYKEGADFLVNVQVQVVTDADLDALDTILATFDTTL